MKKNHSVVLQKIVFANIASAVFAAVISFISLAVFKICADPFGGDLAIQHIPQFELCPIVISINNFALLKILIKIIGICVFTNIIGFIAVLFNNTKISLVVCSAATIGLLLLQGKENNLIGILNPISFIKNNDLLCRYFAINELSLPINGLLGGVILQTLIYAIFAWLISSLFYAGFRLKHTDKSVSTVKKERKYSNGLFAFELQKLISKRVVVFVLIGFAVVKLFSTYFDYFSQYNSDMLYKSYVEKYGGEITEETAEKLIAESERLNSVIESKETVQNDFRSGRINGDEYRSYMQEYWNACISQTAFAEFTDYYNSVKNDPNSHVIYDKGYSIYMDYSWDFCLMLSLVMLMLLIFTEDRLSGMNNIINTTVNGRNKTLSVKFLLMIALSVLLCVAYEAVRIFMMDWFYGLQSLDAPLCSIRNAPQYLRDISIKQGIFIIPTIRVVACTSSVIILSVMICLFNRSGSLSGKSFV